MASSGVGFKQPVLDSVPDFDESNTFSGNVFSVKTEVWELQQETHTHTHTHFSFK